MKYRPSLVMLFLMTVSGLLNSLQAQKIKKDFWQAATIDSIKTLIFNFGQAADLYYDPLSIGFDSENRANPAGVAMFRKLFIAAQNPIDSSRFENSYIVNFLDPDYISAISSCKGNSKCLEDSLFNKLFKQKKYNRELSVVQYLEMMEEIYNNKKLDVTFFPGTLSKIELNSIIISQFREKIANKRYRVQAFAPFSFSAYFNKNNVPVQIELKDHKLIFDISFDAIKTAGKVVYANYTIDKVSDDLEYGISVRRAYLLTILPFVNLGYQSVSGTIANNDIVKAYQNNGSTNYQFGLMMGRKLKVFKSEYSDVTVAVGAKLSHFSLSNSLSGYLESPSLKLEDAPFRSSILTKYNLKSEVDEIEFNDNFWLLGLPLRLGIDFNIDKKNKVRGYLNTELSYLVPLASTTKTNGKIDQSGVFEYNHPTYGITTIEINNDKDFADYGIKDAYSNKGSEWERGGELKIELGASFDLKKDIQMNIGPYFSAGYLTNKNSPREYLAEQGGRIYSPLNSMDQLNFFGYGISLSMSFDINKLKGK